MVKKLLLLIKISKYRVEDNRLGHVIHINESIFGRESELVIHFRLSHTGRREASVFQFELNFLSCRHYF